MKTEQRDETIQAALDSLPEQERENVDQSVRVLADTISNMRGGRGFGVKRSRELLFALGMFMERKEAA